MRAHPPGVQDPLHGAPVRVHPFHQVRDLLLVGGGAVAFVLLILTAGGRRRRRPAGQEVGGQLAADGAQEGPRHPGRVPVGPPLEFDAELLTHGSGGGGARRGGGPGIGRRRGGGHGADGKDGLHLLQLRGGRVFLLFSLFFVVPGAGAVHSGAVAILGGGLIIRGRVVVVVVVAL